MLSIFTLTLLAISTLASAGVHPTVRDVNGAELVKTEHINGNTYYHAADTNPHASLHPNGSDVAKRGLEARGWLLKDTICTIGWGQCAGDAGCYRCGECLVSECLTPQVGDCFC